MTGPEPSWQDIRRWRASMRRRLKTRPESLIFWTTDNPTDAERNCTYCGRYFRPNFTRTCAIPGAPPSVVTLHHNAFCSQTCATAGGYPTSDDGRIQRIQRTKTETVTRRSIFERDNWYCYLCGRPTSLSKQEADRSRRPTVDHVVPLSANGTHDADNLRCACARCNGEKGASTLWEKIRFILQPPDSDEDVLLLLLSVPDLADLIALWRYYYFDGDEAQEWQNKPTHSLVEPIVRKYPTPQPLVLVRRVTTFVQDGRIISRTELTDGSIREKIGPSIKSHDKA